MMMMKLPILPCTEKLELVLSTAPKTRDNTDKDSKTENGPISRGSQFEVSMVRDLWGKRLTKKVSFEFKLKCTTVVMFNPFNASRSNLLPFEGF